MLPRAFVLSAAAAVAVGNQVPPQQWAQPQHGFPSFPRKHRPDAVIAAFFNQPGCTDGSSVVNTLEGVCQALPPQSGVREFFNKQFGHDGFEKHRKDRDFGFFAVVCNERHSGDFDWYEAAFKSYGHDGVQSKKGHKNLRKRKDGKRHGGHFEHDGYWVPRPTGGFVRICADSHCQRCQTIDQPFLPLQCINVPGGHDHQWFKSASAQFVCVAQPKERKEKKVAKKAVKQVEEKKVADHSSSSTAAVDDSSSSASVDSSSSSAE